VLKPIHSAFYMTPLEVLLQHLQVETLILTGLTSNRCITVTAHDGFNIYIPPDCSCARNSREHTQTLAQLGAMAGANLLRSTSLKFRISSVHRSSLNEEIRNRRITFQTEMWWLVRLS
jgi:nicotinamidase-related amidase